jgi:hypothetical protein
MTPLPPRALAALAAILALALAAVAAPTAARGTAQAAAQSILIESPAPGTQVGSPLVVTGSVSRLPASASLSYAVLASDGRLLGSGAFAVPGNPGEPAYFIASLTFQEPPDGDGVTLQLIDPGPDPGSAAAVVTLPLVTAPLPQRILVDTPPAGAQVGNPVVLTGRTVRFPAAGVLGYAIYDASGAQVGGGVFPVAGSPADGGSFAASLSFLYPELGGPLRVDLYDQDPVTGAFPATATVVLQTVALVQQIVVETPQFGTQVGSPVVITGRAARFPAGGVLQYRITDAAGALLAAGALPVNAAPGQSARFVAELSFQPPAAPGPVRAQVFELDGAGRPVASAFADMRWGP